LAEVIDARKERYDVEAAWDLIQSAKSITIAKGKKINHWEINDENKADILKNAMGPSGNLRAPTFKIKDQFLIGFNLDLYDEKIK
jgi:hypothetical protein